MSRLFRNFRTAYEQCFIPIFVRDGYDTDTLLEGCRLAGIRALEYTLRREDARAVILTLKSRMPDVGVFCGSTIDGDEIVLKMRDKFPQLMTLEELKDAGVDGLVSYLPFSDETIRKYKEELVLIPSADTAGEALREMRAGAHVIKVSGNDVPLIKACRAAPTFGFCPLFVTGGCTVERMPEIFGLGAVMTAAGFDLTLRGIAPEDLTAELVCERLTLYRDAARKARLEKYPEMRDLETLSDEEFLKVLPHYTAF